MEFGLVIPLGMTPLFANKLLNWFFFDFSWLDWQREDEENFGRKRNFGTFQLAVSFNSNPPCLSTALDTRLVNRAESEHSKGIERSRDALNPSLNSKSFSASLSFIKND